MARAFSRSKNLFMRIQYELLRTTNVKANIFESRYRASDISSSSGAAKFTKTRKIPRNSVEILSTTCLYNIYMYVTGRKIATDTVANATNIFS